MPARGRAYEVCYESMWIARPIYELLPYLYMVVGILLLSGSWTISTSIWPTVMLVLGSLSLLAGLVIWLRRRDYRSKQTEYNSKSLDE